MPCLNTVLQPNDRKSAFNKSTLANPVVSSYCCSPVPFFITPWAVSLFISGPPLALLQGITAGNYWSRMLIASSSLPEFHSHLIESGSETNTGHAGYVYLQLHHFYKNAPVRETSCQPTANWSLPYALVVRLDPNVPLSFWLTHMDTSAHTYALLIPFHHTPVEIRGLCELPLHFVFSYCRWRLFRRASTFKGCLVAEVIMLDVLFPLLRLSGIYSGY